LVPLFDFLKKKNKIKIEEPSPISKFNDNESDYKKDLVVTHPAPKSEKPPTQQSKVIEIRKQISIPEAVVILHSKDELKVKELVSDLAPIKSSVEKVLKSTEKIADDLEKENIKVEEPRFESIVDNSKRTIIVALRKESSSVITAITTLDDAIKFEARLESIVNRFSALSSSHSRVLNVFVKKYASKLQSESNAISNLSRKCKGKLTDYQKFKQSIDNTEELLNSLSEHTNSIKDNCDTIDRIESEIRLLQNKLDIKTNELSELQKSKEHFEISALDAEIVQLETEEHDINQQTVDLFGHLNRAITKYSYGIPAKRDLSIKLQTMATEPWKIYYKEVQNDKVSSKHRTNSRDFSLFGESEKQADANEFLKYLSILREIQSAIRKGTIDLKDSEKISYYLEQAIESLPRFNLRLSDIGSQRHSLMEQKARLEILSKINVLEDFIKHANDAIIEKRKALELVQGEVSEKHSKINDLISETQNDLFKIAGQRYDILF
jgi:hypothetical protein